MCKKYFILIVIYSLFIVSCSKIETSMQPQTKLALGTVCTVNLFEDGTQDLYDEIFERVKEIEELMSARISTSEVSRINTHADIKPLIVSEDTFAVIKMSLDFAHKTNGAFNPAIGPLVGLWGIGTQFAKIPKDIEIQEAIKNSNYKNIVLNSHDSENSIVLLGEKMSLDLGGVAKGYATDQIVEILEKYGVKSAIIDLGGNIFAYGKKENNAPWRIGIKNPFDSEGQPIIAVEVKNESVVTSGVYERFFEQDGIRYHHLLDSKTGYPVDNALMSVTIVHESSTIADILSTAVFALGADDGIKLLENMGVQGFCIDSNKEIYASSAIARNLEIINKDFSLCLEKVEQ